MTEPDMCSVCGSTDIEMIHEDHYLCESCIHEMKHTDAVIICPICDEDITALVYEEESTENSDEDIRYDSSEESE